MWLKCTMGAASDLRQPSLLDRLAGLVHDRVDDVIDAPVDVGARDPELIASVLERVDLALKWFDPEVQGMERLPDEGPFLIAANHSGGLFMPDFWAFQSAWARERGPDPPLFSLGFDLVFSLPGMADVGRRLGSVPARPETGAELLRQGAAVLVYPGGDEDDYRPWTERHRIDLHGHTGFVRLALRSGVPVVPLVSHGSHDALIVVFRGDELARALHLDRFRIHVLPVVLGPVGPLLFPVAGPPLPTKVVSRVCEPFDWTGFGPEAADDPEVVRHCYEEMLGRMQTNLDELVEEVPHPVRARLAGMFGLGRRSR